MKTTRTTVIAALVLALGTADPPRGVAQEESEYGTLVRGRVVRAIGPDSTEPVPLAFVTLEPANSKGRQQKTLTDSEGFYYFSGVEPVPHSLRVSGSRRKGPSLVVRTIEVPSAVVLDVSEIVLPEHRRSLRVFRGKALKPISLLYDRESDTAYAVSAIGHKVFALDRRRGELTEIGKLNLQGTASDHCLLKQGERTWIVSASSRQWTRVHFNYVTLTEFRRGRPEPFETSDRYSRTSFGAQLTGLACDHESGSLYVGSLRWGTVYSMRISEGQLEGAEEVGELELKRPFSLAVSDGFLYVADLGLESVLRIDSATGSTEELIGDLDDPSGLSVSPDGNLLLGGDTDDSWVFQKDLQSGELRQLLGPEDGIGEPVATQMLDDGTILVADRRRDVVFELSRD